MNWLRYLAEANLYLGVFYLGYCFLLNKETYYMLNRVYLLLSAGVSFILPIVQLGILRPAEQPASEITIEPVSNYYNHAVASPVLVQKSLNLQDYLLDIYLAGAAVLLVMLAIKLYQLLRLTRSKCDIIDGQYKLIYIDGSNTAFSFFNFLFIGTKAHGVETIIRHELVHIRQKHSLDIILLEIFKIINWFNPLVYLLQNSLKAIHEYIADEKTALDEPDALTYSKFLCNNAYGVGGLSLTHSFFNYNLLKKRIIMLNQQRSGSLARLKYLVALPLCGALLCASTLGFSKTYGWVDLAPARHIITIYPAVKPDTTTKFDAVNTTSKGYKYKETGYLLKNKSGYKSNFRVIIYEKNGDEKGFMKNSATTAELKLLREKYGYKFPDMDIYPALPPPPPMKPNGAPANPPIPAGAKKLKRLPPPIVIMSDTAAPAKPADVEKPKGLPPPPPPMRPHMPLANAFSAMAKYIAKYVRYPAVARDNKLTGSVIAQFDLTTDHKIGGVTLIKGIGSSCDEEAIRVLNTFNDPIYAKPGTYKVAITFAIDGMNMPKPGNEISSNDPLFIGEAVVVTYL